MIASRFQTFAEPKARSRPQTLYVAGDVSGLRTVMVNLYFVALAGPEAAWVLVDTGLPFFTQRILDAAQRLYGFDLPPKAIVLTHGHFDHVGTVRELASQWNVPVYAHEEELPYLTGQLDYPPPDPTVGGGLLARMAALYPRRAIDLGNRAHPLPPDGTIPDMPGWQWIHTPGHTPGHVSLYREADRVLLAGDAFVTTRQESALAVLLQEAEVHGPPAYFTPDWDAARESVRKLASLRPLVAATGHGLPMRGEELDDGLQDLARNFDRVAVPRHGRYVPTQLAAVQGRGRLPESAKTHASESASAHERTRSLAFPSNKALFQVLSVAGVAIGAAALFSAWRRRGTD